MIKRELYMSRIRPFIGGELIKVVTGLAHRLEGRSASPFASPAGFLQG